MKLLLKDQFRKIKLHKFNFISLSLLVIIISMTFTAVKTSIRRLDENYESYLETQQLEDFYFNMGNLDVNYLGGNALVQLCTELDILYECGYALSFDNDPTHINNLNILINQKIIEKPEIYENIIDGYVDDFAEEYDYTVEKNLIVDITIDDYAYKFISLTTKMNLPYLVEGKLPELDNEIAIFPEFAELNDLKIGDTYTIRDQDYTITGYIYKPEFLFPIFSLSTVTFEPEKQTLVLATEQTIKNLNEYIFVKYLVQGDLTELFPDYGYANIQSNDYSVLGKHMQMVFLLMPADINFRIIALPTEITNANAFINVFLPLFTGLIVMLLLVFMKRYIDSNKKDINTLHAMGYTRKEITLSLLLYPFLVSLTAFIGYLLGLLLSTQLFDIYSARYLFPKAGFVLYSDLILTAVIIPVVVITLINYIFIRQTIAKKPKPQKNRFLRFSKFVETKTILSTGVLLLTISIMITFGLNGNSMFSAFIDETKQGNNYTEMINLQFMTNTHHLDTYEDYTKMPAKIIEVNSREVKVIKSTSIYGISSTSQLKRLINDKIENNLLLEDGVIISDYLQTSLNLEVGDTITFEVGGVTSTEKIVGISNELIENNFFILQSKLNAFFNLDDTYYNGLFVTDYDYQSPYITSRIDYQNTLEEFSVILNISSLILNYLIVLSIILSLFIFVLVLTNFFVDHKIDIAVLKSIGYNNLEIHKKYLLVIYIVMIILYILSIPITNYILNLMLGMIMETIGFKLIATISVWYILIGFIMLHIAFGTTTYYITKYYDGVQISDIIKHNIK